MEGFDISTGVEYEGFIIFFKIDIFYYKCGFIKKNFCALIIILVFYAPRNKAKDSLKVCMDWSPSLNILFLL